MIKMDKCRDREEWLKARGKRIGGSDAAAVVGMNPWMDAVKLWRIKTGKIVPDEIKGNPLVEYGNRAEPLLRELFLLDHPDMILVYEPNNIWTNTRYPWAHASLDGWLYDSKQNLGILEIKTATIAGAAQAAKWKDRIPDNYYCQILHYMAVTGAEFAILKAQLKYHMDAGGLNIRTLHYRFEWTDVQRDIEYLMQKEAEFWEHVEADTEPPLILPAI